MKVLPLLLLATAGCTGGIHLDDVTLDVNFVPARRAAMMAQTPDAYRIALQYVNLQGATPFMLFQEAGPADAQVFAFTANEDGVATVLPPDVDIPDDPYEAVDLGIVYLEMDLSFTFDADSTVAVRTLRIYFEPVGDFLPGDVTVVGQGPELWVFGPGNVTSDPMMTGLDRATAYNMTAWPDGRLISESGPFGNTAFWDAAPSDPFHWETDLPSNIENEAQVVFWVADTWNYTDQAEDGVYNWPTDYGNDWHMDFPEITVLE